MRPMSRARRDIGCGGGSTTTRELVTGKMQTSHVGRVASIDAELKLCGAPCGDRETRASCGCAATDVTEHGDCERRCTCDASCAGYTYSATPDSRGHRCYIHDAVGERGARTEVPGESERRAHPSSGCDPRCS